MELEATLLELENALGTTRYASGRIVQVRIFDWSEGSPDETQWSVSGPLTSDLIDKIYRKCRSLLPSEPVA